jgi:hypothetical protein
LLNNCPASGIAECMENAVNVGSLVQNSPCLFRQN